MFCFCFDNFQEIETELRGIEAIKEEYQKKNYEQVSFLDQFPVWERDRSDKIIGT